MAYRFFVNPIAGNGIAEKSWRSLQIYLNEQSIAYDVFFSKTSGAIEEQMRLLNQDQSQLVIIGGGIKILPDASSVDGLFDIILVDRPKSLGRLIWLIGALLRGNHYQYSEVHHFKSSQIGLQSGKDEYSHLDGEVVPARKNILCLTSKKYPFYI